MYCINLMCIDYACVHDHVHVCMHVHADVYSMCGCKVFMHVINACH